MESSFEPELDFKVIHWHCCGHVQRVAEAITISAKQYGYRSGTQYGSVHLDVDSTERYGDLYTADFEVEDEDVDYFESDDLYLYCPSCGEDCWPDVWDAAEYVEEFDLNAAEFLLDMEQDELPESEPDVFDQLMMELNMEQV